MGFTRQQKVVVLSVFLSMILGSFTVLQYTGGPVTRAERAPRARYLIENYEQSTTSDYSHSPDSEDLINGPKATVAIESCLGVEEPAKENVR